MTVTESNPAIERDGRRLVNYEQTSSGYMIALALIFVAVYSVPVLNPDIAHWFHRTCDWVGFVIWAIFLLDLVVRVVLSKRHLRYLMSHPLDVLIVALPILRPLRVLRVFTAGRTLINSTGKFPLARASWAIVFVAVLLVFMGGVAVLDAERHVPGANIKSPGAAFWWAASDVTTVSQTTNYPVSETGRAVAIALSVLGLSLIGVITAAIATWFITMTRISEQNIEDQIDGRLDVLEGKLDSISRSLESR